MLAGIPGLVDLLRGRLSPADGRNLAAVALSAEDGSGTLLLAAQDW